MAAKLLPDETPELRSEQALPTDADIAALPAYVKSYKVGAAWWEGATLNTEGDKMPAAIAKSFWFAGELANGV